MQARLTVFLLFVGGPATAHPHVFIDTSVTAVLDAQGRLAALRLRWDYDDYVSLLLVEEKGADTDGDGQVSASEMSVLNGFDMAWGDTFDGDTKVMQDGSDLPLTKGPQNWSSGWQDGHLWSEHTRVLTAPVDLSVGPVTVLVHDDTDYTAYTYTGAAILQDGTASSQPSACRIEVLGPGDTAPDGFLQTIGLFMFGSERVSTTLPAPSESEGPAIRLTCDG